MLTAPWISLPRLGEARRAAEKLATPWTSLPRSGEACRIPRDPALRQGRDKKRGRADVARPPETQRLQIGVAGMDSGRGRGRGRCAGLLRLHLLELPAAERLHAELR